jgi:hypothetical protein
MIVCRRIKDLNELKIKNMTTVTIDLLNENAITLLRDLELLKLIRLRREKEEPKASGLNLVAKYKGAMSRQPINDIDQQLKSLRSEWE